MQAPDGASPARRRALEALAGGDELTAIRLLRGDVASLTRGSRDWAQSAWLLGSALIRVSWEVEGTGWLDEAGAVLDALGVERPRLPPEG